MVGTCWESADCCGVNYTATCVCNETARASEEVVKSLECRIEYKHEPCCNDCCEREQKRAVVGRRSVLRCRRTPRPRGKSSLRGRRHAKTRGYKSRSCLAEESICRARNPIAAVVLGDDGVSTRRQDEELRDGSNRHLSLCLLPDVRVSSYANALRCGSDPSRRRPRETR